MDPPDGLTRGFLFADLRNYTDYVEAHGDQAAAELLERYRALVRRTVAAARGAEIRTEGDSFYVVFPSASAAVRCGLAIVETAAATAADERERPIRVGVGVHAGETVETAEGFVGSAVNIAARICAQAQAGHVVVSETVRSLTRTSLEVSFVPLGARRLKGVDELIPLYRVVPASAGVPARSIKGYRHPGRRRMYLVAGGAVVVAALGAAIIAGALVLSGGRTAAPSPGSASEVGTLPVSSSASSTSPRNGGLTSDEQLLLARIPLEFEPYCRRSSEPDGSAGGLVSLRCDLPVDSPGYGADTVWYDTFSSRGSMVLAIDAITNREALAVGDCATRDVKALGRWSLGTTFTGQLACYAKTGGEWFLWSYEGDQILARAVRRDGDGGALRMWWKERAAGFLR